jgi:hypothetical protein
VKTKSWNLAILMGIVLGASLGGIVALIVFRRRSKEGPGLAFKEIPWSDLIRLMGPIFALGRQLLQMGRREISKPDTL